MRVLVVDDHPIILFAMQQVLAADFPDVDVTGATSFQEARAVVRAGHAFDLILLGVHLPDGNGLDLIAEWRTFLPPPPIVVLTGSDRMSDVVRAIDEGAAGFVSKRATPETLMEAVRVVLDGGVCFPPLRGGGFPVAPSVAERPVGWLGAKAWPSRGTSQTYPVPSALALEALHLTPRQGQVLTPLMQGKANKVIARELGLSVETVKDHVAAILRCVGVASRQQVLPMLMQQGGSAPPARYKR